MAITYLKFFEPTVLPITTPITLMTVGGPTSTILRGGRIRLSNTTSTAVSVTLYAVPLSSSAAAGNVFCPALVVPANGNIDVDVPLMKLGDFIQAVAGAATSITAQMTSGALFA